MLRFRCEWIACGVLAAMLGLAGQAASSGPGAGRVSGVVTDPSGVPVPGAAISLAGTALSALTDADGRYALVSVAPGGYTLSARASGFGEAVARRVEVSAGMTSPGDLRFAADAAARDTSAAPPSSPGDTWPRRTILPAAAAVLPAADLPGLLSYEPNVNVNENGEVRIRGSAPSEVRVLVDGAYLTDALTGVDRVVLNRAMVEALVVLPGGVGADVGRARSGVVSMVYRDGTGGGSWPRVTGAVEYAPAQQKHFGPGAYDEDQYDYWVMSSRSPFADGTQSVNNIGEIYWPLLYEETATHLPTLEAMAQRPESYRAVTSFEGWESAAERDSHIRLTSGEWEGSFGKSDWTAEEARAAWEYEANMNEQAWEYAHLPDVNADVAASWALPQGLGGLVLGYSWNRIMTVLPARVPYYRDASWDGKLTLTPMEDLRLALSFSSLESYSTGGAAFRSAAINDELSSTGASVAGSDPVSLRSASDLMANLLQTPAEASKLNLSCQLAANFAGRGGRRLGDIHRG